MASKKSKRNHNEVDEIEDVKAPESKYPPHLQAAYDELSEDGKVLFDISFDENRDPSEFMTTDQIHAEIARRRGSITR